MQATIRKAGGKSPAESVGCCSKRSTVSTTNAPTATPVEIESCWATLTSEVARLMRRGSTSAKAMVFTLVNCSERNSPPTSSTATMTQTGVSGPNAAHAPSEAAASSALTVKVRRNPNRRRMRAAPAFIVMAPTAVESVISPDWNGDMPRPICKRSGKRNGNAPAPMRKTNPPATPARKVGSRNSDRSMTAVGVRRA